jgi:pSer/pThr/pTyr-binding forkhead associated (FHA) protein
MCDVCGASIPTPDGAAPTAAAAVLVLPWGEHRLHPGDEVDIGRDVGPWQREFEAFDTVSRRHVTLRVSQAGRLLLRDHGSTNGTWINGTRCPPTGEQEVPDGAELRLSTRFAMRVRFEG